MNTLADAVTLFTEPEATVNGPIVQGPTLYEWCILARDGAHGPDGAAGPLSTQIPPERAAAALAYPPRDSLATDYAAELAELRPESHPSRALYGEYLEWFFDRAIAELPDSVHVTRVTGQATAIEQRNGREAITVTLPVANTTTVLTDAVVLSTGWLDRSHTRAEQTIANAIADHPGLTWIEQGSPVEQDLSRIAPGEHVIVRGLGMGFFDTMALLTAGRGGNFVPDEHAPGGLRYEPSGQEPILHVTSRRGVPFRAKSRYGGLPPRAAQRLLLGADWANEPRPINFDRALWPRIVADAFIAHAETLHRVHPEAFVGDPDTALEALTRAAEGAIRPVLDGTAPTDLDTTVATVAAATAPFIADEADRFDLAGEIHPATQHFDSPAAYDAWIASRVAHDLAEVDRGIDSPLKAGLWSISSARAVANRIDEFGGFDAESRANGAELLAALGGMVGSGPPAFRNNQLLALAAAGLVHFIGPAAQVTIDDRGFVASSPAVTGSEVVAPALIDSWMHFHDIRASADPLTQSLLAAGRARPFSIAVRAGAAREGSAREGSARDGSGRGGSATTAGFDIDAPTGLLIHTDGTLDSAVHIAGIPVDETIRGTVISPMPGTDPIMLRETDRVALSALRIAHDAPHPSTFEGALHG